MTSSGFGRKRNSGGVAVRAANGSVRGSDAGAADSQGSARTGSFQNITTFGVALLTQPDGIM